MSDTSGEDWLAMRLADVGKAWKEDVARLTSRIADLERAAETTRAEHATVVAALSEAYATNEFLRAEHAAALGLATARIRELEGEREELLGLVGLARDLIAGANLITGDQVFIDEARAIGARIEKATKGTT